MVDALFYDFDPLQGLPKRSGTVTPGFGRSTTHARISTVEIAIRASAKRFLSHPLVVQQLEAVWAGNIVFHSAADRLHRRQPDAEPGRFTSSSGRIRQPAKGKNPAPAENLARRSVTLYNPSNASLFKLSRLRVPRYRQLFSSISYVIMLGLFLAVLVERSIDITTLELIFWFWSAGYLLDEVVGFSEQGFSLYILSVWNSFDIAILLMTISYYLLRIYGILFLRGKHRVWMANQAYDLLAATAIFLMPRAFSVLDHYRYFSQLLIAFRMMALDFAAVLILIVISCSGFFVAFTLSYSGREFSASQAAYHVFQMLLGFTPAAWESWGSYNILGKATLASFLLISHFLIVTILITVLTNSFMAIVQNANEEHLFLFAVNTISNVKSDALFSYIAPTNIIGWVLSPLRYVMPFRHFVRLNRSIIKLTHVPILLLIFVYERLVLARGSFEPTQAPGFILRTGGDLFSPGVRLREPSVATFHQDQALEEVFRRPFRGAHDPHMRTAQRESYQQAKSQNVVNDWMRSMGREGGAHTPLDEEQSVLDRLERNSFLHPRKTAQAGGPSRMASYARSVASDPDPSGFAYIHEDHESPDISRSDRAHHTENDGDDELATNDDDDAGTTDEQLNSSDKENEPAVTRPNPKKPRIALGELDSAAFGEDVSPLTPNPKSRRRPTLRSQPDSAISSSPERPATQQRLQPSRYDLARHVRTASSATILFAPLEASVGDRTPPSVAQSPPKTAPSPHSARSSARGSAPATAAAGNSGAGTPHPRRSGAHAKDSSRPPSSPPAAAAPPNATAGAGPLTTAGGAAGPPPPARRAPRPPPNLASFLALGRRKPSLNALALDLASDLGDNRAAPAGDAAALLGASFGTQLEMAALRRGRQRVVMSDDGGEDDDDEDEVDNGMGRFRGYGAASRLNRIVLARMTTLEEGFKEVLREVKGLNQSRGGSGAAGE
jgi:hypothetical protein